MKLINRKTAILTNCRLKMTSQKIILSFHSRFNSKILHLNKPQKVTRIDFTSVDYS